MNTLYRLEIKVIDGEINKFLKIVTESLERAKEEIHRWADFYMKEWNVPTVSTKEWTVREFNTDTEMQIKLISTIFYKQHNMQEDKRFVGVASRCDVLKDTDEILALPGTVCRSHTNPSVYCTIKSPYKEGDDNVVSNDYIDVNTKQRVQPTIGGVEFASNEEERLYHKVRNEILDKDAKDMLEGRY